LNQGIGGNALVSGGIGPTALQRFARDVLEQDGVRWVILLEGVNDIGAPDNENVAAALIEGFQTLIDSAHARGLLIYGSPILPFGGSQYESRDNDAARQQVNHWIRTAGAFDAVLDFEAVVRDPDAPERLRPEYDSGDHLHLSVAGLQALADAVDLKLFE
jgi:lysophospholipase L1-like esterase